MQMMDHRGQNDQKNYAQEDQILLDQDREQIDANESLQLRGDEPVSELYIWGSKYTKLITIDSVITAILFKISEMNPYFQTV